MFSSPLTPSRFVAPHVSVAQVDAVSKHRPHRSSNSNARGPVNWIRRGAWAAFGVATLAGAEAHRTFKHGHHGIGRRDASDGANPYNRPWLVSDAKVIGPKPWLSAPQRRAPSDLDRRQQYDTSAVDWSAIDWSQVSFADTDWSAIDYTNTQPVAVTYTYTVQAAATPAAQASLLQNGQFGAGNNYATQTAQTANTPMTTLATQATPLIQVGNGVFLPAAGATTTQAPTAAAADPTSAAAAAPVVATQIGSGPNSVSIQNNGPQNQFAFFANAGQYQPTFGQAYAQITLASGQSETVLLPQSWSGRVQKVSGQVADPATWAEMTFDGYNDLTFFDVSYIRGYNGPVLMQAADGSAQSGSSDNFLATASPDLETTDSAGNTVLQPTEPYTGGTNDAVVSFLRSMVASRQAYVQNFDNDASIATADHDLVITFS